MRGKVDNKKITDFNLYDLFYRSAMFFNKEIIALDVNVSDATDKKLNKILKELEFISAKYMDEIKFSDVIYEIFPEINQRTKIISFNYKPVSKKDKKNIDISNHIERYKNFNVDNLPLIEVAKAFNIRVEKSNTLETLGRYVANEKKIILASDYVPTFIHELVHGIDRHMSDYIHDENFNELVAELSTIFICKIFSIPINVSYSIHYLDAYSTMEVNVSKMIKRASEIAESIIKIKEHIDKNR
ncbi:MAG: hypothetical protein FWG77_03875 [Treponema sp.]|nr:hypothetical protein [Treponema sp.]